MLLYPAIDIRGGRAVRLRQGRFDEETVYASDPLEAARDWVDQGARALHVVDLDGAREGAPRSLDHLGRIASELDVPVQYGGGLRSLEAVERALAGGAARVVLGTAAHRDPELLSGVLDTHGGRIAVAIDVRDGRMAIEGWLGDVDQAPLAVADRMKLLGVESIVYTDTARDGMLEGPELEPVAEVARAFGPGVVYSGGIGALDHLRALAQVGEPGLEGVIVGKALYERRFTVAEGQAALEPDD